MDSPNNETNENNLVELPPYKKTKTEEGNKVNSSPLDSIDHLFCEFDEPSIHPNIQKDQENSQIKKHIETRNGSKYPSNDPSALDAEINEALMSFNKFNGEDHIDFLLNEVTQQPKESKESFASSSSSSSTTSENCSPFDSPDTLTSITSNEEEYKKPALPSANAATVASLRQAMVGTSKLVSLFTVLKVTYLKLCKEFNYLLSKFNENERIKIELIHENNEIKRLLADVIKRREVDNIEHKKELQRIREEHKMTQVELQQLQQMKEKKEAKKPEAKKPKAQNEQPNASNVPAATSLMKTEETLYDSRTLRRKRRAEESLTA